MIITINDICVETDIAIQYCGTIKLLSIAGSSKNINAINKSLKYKGKTNYGTMYTIENYNVYKTKDEQTGIVHEILIYKNQETTEDNDFMTIFSYGNSEEELNDALYDNLNKYTSIPLLVEWKYYIINALHLYISSPIIKLDYYIYKRTSPIFANILHIRPNSIYNIIKKGLEESAISINNSRIVSSKLEAVHGLDDYLNSYSDILANKIKDSFVPHFTPGNDKFSDKLSDFDDVCHDEGLDLFFAQKCTIQSVVNTLKSRNLAFIIGEQGSGKTVMSLGACYAANKKKSFNTFVICPAHLVNKWSREIEKYVPNGKAYIVKNISDLQKIDHIIRNKNKTENSFIVISKESAKLDTECRPNVSYSISKKGYVCPKCGETITNKNDTHSQLGDTDFLKPNRYNTKCIHYNRYSSTDYGCSNNLWIPISQNNDGWIKLGSIGWIHKSRIDNIIQKAKETNITNKQDAELIAALTEYKDNPDAFRQPTTSRYPLGKYIRKYYRGYVDYLIGDELHLYNGDSAQGEAFGQLVSVAKKTIGLTGTLLNGYAEGLFNILFRTMPSTMIAEGFNYDSKEAFNSTFGVIKTISKTTRIRDNSGRTISKTTTSKKKLPGVSPLVFTKFLLESAVFVNLSDMLDGLPNYKETPIGISMDSDLQQKYDELEINLATEVRKNGKLISSMTKVLSAYPDMPYNMLPLTNPETGQQILTPKNVEDKDMIRPKEQQLINIVKEEHDKGNKVLVYYHWTNITNIDERLPKLLQDEGFKTAVLKSSVNAQAREEWIRNKIKKENIDVLFSNPTLVETGLDLLDFNTIVFYEMGYNLYTMRQASRRSWRLGQTKPVQVYYLYYNDTIQEQGLALMASKLQASMAIEGKFSEEGLQALSNTEDLLTQIANSIVSGIKHKVSENCFKEINTEKYHKQDEPDTFVYDEFADILSDDTEINYDEESSADKLIEDDPIVQHIITEPKKIFRKTKYEVEGKRYINEYWKYMKKNNITSLLESEQTIFNLC